MKRLLVLLCTLVPASLHSDVVVLKNGNEIQGEILHEGRNHLTVKFPGGTLRLSRRQILRIDRQTKETYLIEESEKAVRRRDYETAIAGLEQATRQDPESDRARIALVAARKRYGAHLRELHRFTEAITTYKQVLDVAPNDRDAKEELEMIREAQDDAREEISQARVELQGGDVETSLHR
ncbi:MAG: tetratricopeptide repeat protein, partial [Planctomycetota bacterium]